MSAEKPKPEAVSQDELERWRQIAYRLARTVCERDGDMDLLGQLRALDPERYDAEVAHWRRRA